MQTSSSPNVRYPVKPTYISLQLAVLTTVTLGIYPIIKFYQVISSYEEYLGRPPVTIDGLLWGRGEKRSQFFHYFYFYIIANIASVGFAIFNVPATPLLLILSGIFGGFCLHHALKTRDEVIGRAGLNIQIVSNRTHIIFWIVGYFLGIFVVGLVPLIIQGYWFFDENTRIAEGMRAAGLLGTSAGQNPAFQSSGQFVLPMPGAQPAATANTPTGKFCGECGSRVPLTARFCTKCGAVASST